MGVCEVKLIAHRGANKRAPQNTLAAFRAAREMKIDGFETDVHLTKDGQVVICHNPNIDETSNGKGYINDLTYEQLLQFEFGSYFSTEFAGEKIPLLTDFLDLAAGLEIINIEIKTPYNKDYSVVDETLKIAAEKDLSDHILISSFDPVVLRRVKDVDSSVHTALLYDFTKKAYWENRKNLLQHAIRLGCSALHPYKHMINEEMIRQAHEAGMFVNCWTVNDSSGAKKLQAIGADGLITDVPDRLQAFRDKEPDIEEVK